MKRADKEIWIKAYQKEINNLEKVGGMTVVNMPINEEIIDTLDIFSWKNNTFTNTQEAKVRIVGRGDKAVITLSIYSPVGGNTGMRLLIQLKLIYFDSSPLCSADVKAAYFECKD